MKNLKLIATVFLFIVWQSISAQNNYIQSTNIEPAEPLHLIHNSGLQLGNSTSSSDRLRCLLTFGDNANVQIGEWEADNKLSFKAFNYNFTGGAIYSAENIFVASGKRITIGASVNPGSSRLSIHHNGTHGYIDYKENLCFRADAENVCALALYGNGTVGIGFPTTYAAGQYFNQEAKLAVNGNITAVLNEDKIFTIGGWDIAGVGGMVLQAHNKNNTTNIPMGFAASKFYFHSGSVGIGTSEILSDYRLTVNGNMLCSGNIFTPLKSRISIASSVSVGSPRLSLYHDGVNAHVDFKDNLNFNSDGTTALTIYGNGSIGIGTSNSDILNNYKLAVNGSIVCKLLKVQIDVPSADFVFEDDYSLISIPELETFIKDNKHLPNVPSAEQFKKDGYNVGEMDEMLLRKIEELTLYIIEQDKRIVAIEKENQALKMK